MPMKCLSTLVKENFLSMLTIPSFEELIIESNIFPLYFNDISVTLQFTALEPLYWPDSLLARGYYLT